MDGMSDRNIKTFKQIFSILITNLSSFNQCLLFLTLLSDCCEAFGARLKLLPPQYFVASCTLAGSRSPEQHQTQLSRG